MNRKSIEKLLRYSVRITFVVILLAFIVGFTYGVGTIPRLISHYAIKVSCILLVVLYPVSFILTRPKRSIDSIRILTSVLFGINLFSTHFELVPQGVVWVTFAVIVWWLIFEVYEFFRSKKSNKNETPEDILA